MKVLILGARGLLGSTLCQYLQYAGHLVYHFSRNTQWPCSSESEITDAISWSLRNIGPNCVINLIAATNVDRCEEDPINATLLNYFVPHLLSKICLGGPYLIHISSDQVYSGNGPHLENNAKPINTYACTKLSGELPVIESGACVLRTNFFGKSQSAKRTSFSDWLVMAGRRGEKIKIFEDVLFSPLRMRTLSHAILRAMELQLTGLFNVGTLDGISKASFARLLFKHLELDDSLLESSRLDNLGLYAKRPLDMRMNSAHFATTANFDLPSIEREINHEAIEYNKVTF